jgi:hypothetical protein
MSTNVSIFQQDLPDFLRNSQADALTKSLAGGGSTSKRLSIRGGVFRMVVGGEEVRKASGRELQVIIVNAAPKVSRTFYSGAYSAEQTTAPTCWSSDGIAPDAGVAEPVSKDCAGCPNNIKGSGQGSSRACRFSQRLALQIVGDPTRDVYQLVIPSQSIFGEGDGERLPFQQYIKLLVANGRSINTMVTEISFDTDSATPKLFFRAVAHVNKDQYDSAVTAGESEEAKRAITMNVAQTDGVKKIAAPVAKGEPVAVAEEVEDEPKKRPSKKAEVTEPKKNLADVMDQWN